MCSGSDAALAAYQEWRVTTGASLTRRGKYTEGCVMRKVSQPIEVRVEIDFDDETVIDAIARLLLHLADAKEQQHG
jgi:hypothetical protein